MVVVKNELLIFTYAPAGLGHLRVMDALVDGRECGCPFEVVGEDDSFIRWIHRFTSINPLAKKVYEAFQYGFLEDIFTRVYVGYLRRKGKRRYGKLVDVVNKHKEVDKVVVVASHFGLAHEIAGSKKIIEEKTGKKIYLVVQVTDATWQYVWYVKGADLTLVPSVKVKEELEKFGLKKWEEKQNIRVIPYPLSGVLTEVVGVDREKRFLGAGKINVSIPISGAGTGLTYLSSLLPRLHSLSDRFVFWIVAKETMYNMMFLDQFRNKDWVTLITAKKDHEVVNLYEELFKKELIDIEISKPSEQAFKAILEMNTRGGCVMLFMDPVGRQEYDNIDFLKEHGLIPGRGIVLPKSLEKAVLLITEYLNGGVFADMFVTKKRAIDIDGGDDLGGAGVERFWEEVERLVN